MKLYFELKKKNKDDKEGNVRAIIINAGSKEYISTGIKIEAKNWQEGKPKKTAANANINLALKKYEAAFDKFMINCQLANELPSLSSAKLFVTSEVKSPSLERGKKNFEALIKEFKAEKEGFLREGAIKPYVTMMNDLLAYNPKVQFADITPTFVNKWIKWLSEKAKHIDGATNSQNSTINKKLGALKAFCKWASEKRYTSATEWQNIKKLQGVIDQSIIALTQAEFEQYRNFDFKTKVKNPQEYLPLEQQRDVFCFACYTGLRYQDLGRVKDVIKKSGNTYYIHIFTQKTNRELKMRLVDEAVEILKRYDFKLPIISNQKTNRGIKKGLKLAEITRKERVVVQHLKDVKYPEMYVHQIISIHDARKTFITRCLEGGMSVTEVMALSTHGDTKVLARYIDLERERINDKLQSVFALHKVA